MNFEEKFLQTSRHQASKEKFGKLEKGINSEREEILDRQIGQVEYKKEAGVVTENDKVKLQFDYSFANYHDYIKYPHRIGLLAGYPFSDGWRRLDSFTIIDKKTGKEIDLISDLPAGYTALFNPFCEERNGEAIVEHKGCLVENDIATIHGIIILLHEIGHAIDFERCEKKEERDKWEDMTFENIRTDEDFEFCVSKERNASAYMLKKIKPLIRSGVISKEDILYCIHGTIAGRDNSLWIKIKNRIGDMLDVYF